MKRKLFIISLVCVWYLASINGLIFDRQSAFDDFYPPTHINPLQEHPSHTIIDCARSCDRNQNCSSFFYLDADLPTCQLHEVVWNSTATFNAVNGSKYYKVREPTIPYYPYTGCPVQGEYTPVSLSDGSVFTYKVSTVTANFTEAAAACALDGAELSKVYTPPKLDMIFQIRNDCYGSSAIWIDGNNIEATDFYDLTQWVTSTLDPIPQEYWYPGQPNAMTTDHCLYLYMLDSGSAMYADAMCSLALRYLCEIPYIP